MRTCFGPSGYHESARRLSKSAFGDCNRFESTNFLYSNSWDPKDPEPASTLYASWAPILPLFLRDNVLDQLILPKVAKAVAEWQPHRMPNEGATLHGLIFPWLEHAGLERMDEIIGEAKRRVRHWLRVWRARDGVPVGLDAWREVLTKSEWDSLILKNVLHQLGTMLKDDFKVDPRKQDMAPLQRVVEWRSLISRSMMSGLLEEFVRKWIDALYIWLVHEGNLEEVAQW
jgi:tuftelin-interacting protein 11